MGLALDEPEAEETLTPVNGLEVLISDSIKHLVDNTTIDYINDRYGEGFVVDNGSGSC